MGQLMCKSEHRSRQQHRVNNKRKQRPVPDSSDDDGEEPCAKDARIEGEELSSAVVAIAQSTDQRQQALVVAESGLVTDAVGEEEIPEFIRVAKTTRLWFLRNQTSAVYHNHLFGARRIGREFCDEFVKLASKPNMLCFDWVPPDETISFGEILICDVLNHNCGAVATHVTTIASVLLACVSSGEIPVPCDGTIAIRAFLHSFSADATEPIEKLAMLVAQRAVAVNDTAFVDELVCQMASHVNETIKLLEFLSVRGYDLNQQDASGNTCVHRLLFRSDGTTVVTAMIESNYAGLDLHVPNNENVTVVQILSGVMEGFPISARGVLLLRVCETRDDYLRKHFMEALQVHLIPDLSDLCVQFIDGHARPSSDAVAVVVVDAEMEEEKEREEKEPGRPLTPLAAAEENALALWHASLQGENESEEEAEDTDRID